MFDAIAPTYDLLNHLMSFGLDWRWRKKAVNILTEKRGGVLLDIAAGSGDVSLELLSIRPRKVIAADFALEMLNVFRHKLDGQSDAIATVEMVSCDALRLPFHNASFDGTIVAFGIRNFNDRLAGLHEMLRVLKPGGLTVILELSQPRSRFISPFYRLYAHRILPLLGATISRHNSAYRYLPDSIADFPDKNEFLGLMSTAGFSETRAYSLTFGAAMIYVGRKKS